VALLGFSDGTSERSAGSLAYSSTSVSRIAPASTRAALYSPAAPMPRCDVSHASSDARAAAAEPGDMHMEASLA